MPQWASAESGGTEAESPDQMMYYEDETSEYYDNKADITDKIEQAVGMFIFYKYSMYLGTSDFILCSVLRCPVYKRSSRMLTTYHLIYIHLSSNS